MKKVSMIGAAALSIVALVTVVFFYSCTKDPCKDVVCLNNGSCNTLGACDCVAGYEGTTCDVESRTKFLGSYAGSDQCTYLYTYNATIATSSSDVTKVLVTNPFATGAAVVVTATIDGSNITIPVGSAGNGYTFNGSGTLNSAGDAITWSYTITDSNNNTASCTGTWTLQ